MTVVFSASLRVAAWSVLRARVLAASICRTILTCDCPLITLLCLLSSLPELLWMTASAAPRGSRLSSAEKCDEMNPAPPLSGDSTPRGNTFND